MNYVHKFHQYRPCSRISELLSIPLSVDNFFFNSVAGIAWSDESSRNFFFLTLAAEGKGGIFKKTKKTDFKPKEKKTELKYNNNYMRYNGIESNTIEWKKENIWVISSRNYCRNRYKLVHKKWNTPCYSSIH